LKSILIVLPPPMCRASYYWRLTATSCPPQRSRAPDIFRARRRRAARLPILDAHIVLPARPPPLHSPFARRWFCRVGPSLSLEFAASRQLAAFATTASRKQFRPG